MKLVWTTAPPTEPGYYWVSWKVGWNFADEIVRVRFRRRNCRDTDELIVAPAGTEAQYNLDVRPNVGGANSRAETRRGRPVIESTHAHEHWLRMAASDAIRDIVTTPPSTNLPVTGLLLLNVKSRADDANRAVVVILRREVLK